MDECQIKKMNKVREVAGVTKGVKKPGESVHGHEVKKIITWKSPFAVVKYLPGEGCVMPSDDEVITALKKAGYLK